MARSIACPESELGALLGSSERAAGRLNHNPSDRSVRRPLAFFAGAAFLLAVMAAAWIACFPRGSLASVATSASRRSELVALSTEHGKHLPRPPSPSKRYTRLEAEAEVVPRENDETQLLGNASNISSAELQKEIANKTGWVERFNPRKNLEFLTSEAESFYNCLRGGNNNSRASSLHACYRKMIEDHTQRGLVVPLEKFAWPVSSLWAYIVSGLVVVILLTFASLISLALPLVIMTGLRPTIHLIPPLTPEGLRGECMLQQAQPIVVLAAIGLSFAVQKPSLEVTIPLIFLPALRVAAVDVQLFLSQQPELTCSTKRLWDLKAFLGSKLDVLNAASNGVVLAIVFLMEYHGSQVRHAARIAAAWDGSVSAWVLPLMGHRHSLSCAMFSVMLLASGLELGFTSRLHRIPDFCSAAGLGLTLRVQRREERQIVELGHDDTFGLNEKLWWAIPKLLARVFFEAIPQLYLQGSAVMLSDAGLFDKPILALSIFLSYAAGTEKSLALFGTIRSAFRDSPKRQGSLGPFLAELALAAAALLIVNVGLFRLLLAETCESHIWGLSTGCVVAPRLK